MNSCMRGSKSAGASIVTESPPEITVRDENRPNISRLIHHTESGAKGVPANEFELRISTRDYGGIIDDSMMNKLK